ncbi:MAG: hypothetical protein HC836_47400 [Richelia sp. RM2_1_2]|nr:hypothetical protein [Richelia sp. RM2_1_2]
MIKYLLLISFTISSTSIAETDPFFAPRDYKLTQDSWVFSPDKAKEVRNKLIDLEFFTETNKSLNRSIELYKSNELIYQNKEKILLEQNDNLAKNLNDSRTLSSWERIGWFTLGIAAAVLAGFAIKKAGE